MLFVRQNGRIKICTCMTIKKKQTQSKMSDEYMNESASYLDDKGCVRVRGLQSGRAPDLLHQETEQRHLRYNRLHKYKISVTIVCDNMCQTAIKQHRYTRAWPANKPATRPTTYHDQQCIKQNQNDPQFNILAATYGTVGRDSVMIHSHTTTTLPTY